MPIAQHDRPGSGRARSAGRPRIGVLATHPIQYQAPLYQEIARRGVVELEVAFLSADGAQPFRDPDFGVIVAWDIDLLGGYRSIELPRRPLSGKAAWLARASRWLRRQDVVVIHGHSDPEMLLAMGACKLLGLPYLLRGDAQADGAPQSWRRMARRVVAGTAIRNAAGALTIGQRNAAFYQRYGRIPHFFAPYSVDNERFAAMSAQARPARPGRLEALRLDPRLPTVIFSGKLIEQKRPLDLVRAIEHCRGALNLLMLGDGALRPEVERRAAGLPVRCLGFVNQAALPGWYACADVLALPSGREPWGLVVNEGMACGLVPVVSEAVGAAADLVDGVGEVFPTGDVAALGAALTRAAANHEERGAGIRARLSRFTVAATAAGYEQAAFALGRSPSNGTTTSRRWRAPTA